MIKKTTLYYLLIGVIFISIFNAVKAVDTDPNAPTSVTVLSTTTFNASLYPAKSIEAEAGNISEISISGVSQTIHWQGWYGNISGSITLEDAEGYVMYNWTSAEPQGEIYVARDTTITWDNVACFVGDGTGWNYSTEEAEVDITWDDADGVNETFNETDHPEFWIGSSSITGCPTVWTWVNNVYQTTRFPEVLLEDDGNNVSIYTTLIENKDDGNNTDVVGFDNRYHDFQLMVPENGSLGNLDTTTYYFWVQLN